MRLPAWIRSDQPPQRDRLAVQLALVAVVCLGSAFFLANGKTFLMPGPLTSAHGAIENCSACHTKSGSGKLSWIHGLVAGDPLADSKACLTCHKMPDTAFNAHGASSDALKQSTNRLTKIAAGMPAPQSARAQSIAFPTHDVVARGLYCATCHQEHQGVNFNLNKISNEQCRSCHVVQFDSFDGNHPKFDNYPFNRRTRIIYDHAGHFGKHYPEVAKKDPAKRIPATCSTCHNSNDDKRIMAVAPFEQTCTTCHLDQIVGKERVSGPKGIAFLSLPGLDLEALKKKNAPIGEWPDASEAELTPFMKVMISRNEQGRALLKAVDGVDLQDLTKANDGQIKAVTDLAWEIKRLFHALISGKASDVLADLNIVRGAKLSASLVADLTASIPRDVLISAQQQWLPNLAKEIANGPVASQQEQTDSNSAATNSNSAGSESDGQSNSDDQKQSNSRSAPTEPSSAEPESAKEASGADQSKENASEGSAAPEKAKLDPPACVMRVFGQCLISKEQANQANKAEAGESDGAAGKADAANATAGGGKEESSAGEPPGAMRAGLHDVNPAAEPLGASGKTDTGGANPKRGKETLTANAQPQGKSTDDDLLFPTEEELREIKARNKGGAGKADEPDRAGSAPADAPAGSNTSAEKPQTPAAPVISIESGVDPESWADYGGWYRQDYAIFYRPTGHKDKFIYSWLFLTGPQAPKGNTSPAAAVFDFLTSKDAQGSCTKCHSVDNIQGKGRVVNFSPPSVESKQGRFTRFIHEPHFSIRDDRGCLTCHKLEKDQPGAAAVKTDTANGKPDDAVSADAASKTNAASSADAAVDSSAAAASTDAEKGVSPYLKSYEQGNPHNFVSNFGEVKKDLCQTCHTSSAARQDCLTCHKYHVNSVITPIMQTKIPTQ